MWNMRYPTRRRLRQVSGIGCLVLFGYAFLYYVAAINHMKTKDNDLNDDQLEKPVRNSFNNSPLNTTYFRERSHPTLKSTTVVTSVPSTIKVTHKPTHQPLYTDEVQNPHPFKFTLSNKNTCAKNANGTKRIFLLLLVKTSPKDRFDRMQIRQTWGGVKEVDGRRIHTMFLLGESGNATMDDMVAKEDRQHHDVIREDFRDAYLNLTYKTLMGFKWAAQVCPDAEYVASVDADMLVNVYNIVRQLVGKPRQRYAEGNLRSKVIPIRDPSSRHRKWYTSLDLYPEPTYAPFYTGACYVMSADLAASVFRESMHVRFLPWDDVFVGLVMKRVGVTPTFKGGYVMYVNLKSDRAIEGAIIRGQAVISTHQGTQVNDRIVKIWQKCAAKLSPLKNA